MHLYKSRSSVNLQRRSVSIHALETRMNRRNFDALGATPHAFAYPTDAPSRYQIGGLTHTAMAEQRGIW